MMDFSMVARGATYEQEMKFGARITGDGTLFRLWAPYSPHVRVEIDGQLHPMTVLPRGWHEVEIAGVGAGARYRFVLDDGRRVPDPASRFQPEDADGRSEVIDPRAYNWARTEWRGRAWEETILYEMHVGTFTPEGTFRAAIERLPHLAELGITVIEMMPIADFKGRWNWGYDGALFFAPDSSYGRPEDLKAFIEAAHSHSIGVILDVVYNHLGPVGGDIADYAPVHDSSQSSPWGKGLNFDEDGAAVIRDLILANARYWLNEFRFDGLRLDAIHAIDDTGPRHILQELAEFLRAETDGRHIHLIAENSDNQAGWLKRDHQDLPWLFNAQWNDDLHHALHAAATGESFGYYADYAGRMDLAARALAEGFGYQGEHMQEEDRPKGEASDYLPPTAFISFIQNHDHVGNRPYGERLSALVPEAVCRALAAICLLAPQVPLIFMGEEWAAPEPFLFFSDMPPDLAGAIRESRLKELEGAPRPPGATAPHRDPMAEETFRASKLDWGHRLSAPHARMLEHYRRLIALRKKEIVPRLAGMQGHSGEYRMHGDTAFSVRWRMADGAGLHLAANLSRENQVLVPLPPGRVLWREGEIDPGGADMVRFGPFATLFALEAPH